MNLAPAFLEQMKQLLHRDYESFRIALNDSPAVSIRTHPIKKYVLGKELSPVPWHSEGFFLPKRPDFTLDPAFHAGAYYVQEASSMIIHEVIKQSCSLEKPLRVLDMCAAPGGKSTLLLSAISENSLLIANEIVSQRASILKENLIKWGYPNVVVTNLDPSHFKSLTNYFDVILVDAPCSGEGMFRKDEQAIKHWSTKNVTACTLRQQKILTDVAPLLKEDGVLIYSTCTYNIQENEANIQFLTSNFDLDTLDLDFPVSWNITSNEYGHHFYPHRTKGEGFFVSCLKKRKGEIANTTVKKKSTYWQPLGKRYQSVFTEWIETPEQYHFYKKNNEEIIALPKELHGDILFFEQHLNRFQAGTMIGKWIRDELIPSHDLAVSNIINKDISAIELSKKEALFYLKKETITVEAKEQGWCLVRFEGINLGWIKILKNRINNYYPKNWRIRKDIVGELL